MSFLTSIRPLLHEESEIQIRLRREGAQLSVTVIPKLLIAEPETTDETLAQLQAALSRPFHLTLAEADDPDLVLASVLTTVCDAQSATLDDLASYRAAIEAARAKAKDDAERKQAESAAKKAGDGKAKASPPKAPVAKASTPAATSLPPEPTSISDLFGPSAPLPASLVELAPAMEPVLPVATDDAPADAAPVESDDE